MGLLFAFPLSTGGALPYIDIQQVCHTYPAARRAGPQVALDGVSLGIEAGEQVALLGPNGSGKTTLLRILMTALAPQAGRVSIGGFDVVRQAPAIRRLLGVVFQRPALDVRMTVGENLRAAGLLYGLPRRQLPGRIEALLGQLGLADRGTTLVGALSGGLARRVELARALLPQPRLLVLDEPTTGLDPVARREFWQQVAALRRQSEVTVVLTTHLLDEAQTCDRVAILHQGRLLACDAPEQLQRQVGGQVLEIRGADLEGLGRQLGPLLGAEGRIVGQALRLTLAGPVGLDGLLARFGGQINALSLAHPSLDDVFVQLTGRHLAAAEEAG